MGEPLHYPDSIPHWLQAEVAAYDLPLTRPPATVLDLGANQGAFTLLAAQRWPRTEITAYEPLPDNFLRLRQNLQGCNADVKPINAAVRGFNGTGTLFFGDNHATGSFFHLGRQTQAGLDVPCMDAGELSPAEFVKIDTEGCELEILQRLRLDQTQVLAVEYHRAELRKQIEALIPYREPSLTLHAARPSDAHTGVLIFARRGALESTEAPAVKLFIALPVYGAFDVFFTQSLIKLLADPPCHLALRMQPGDSLVARARNTLTADFLASDATHLLWIDTDLIFSREHVERIAKHTEDIVGGFYPKKQEGEVQWVCNSLNPPGERRADGLQPVKYMGTGFLRISRKVFERMIAAYGERLAYKPDQGTRIEHDFWSVGCYDFPDRTRRYLSEDWFFCQRALDLGFTVWGDTNIILKHVGQAVYPLRSQVEQIFGPAGPSTSSETAAAGVLAPAAAAGNFPNAPRS